MKIRFRELSKFGLWDKSQWTVMSKLAEAINQDVRIILELVRDNARISESLKRDRDNTIKRLQVDMKNRISEADRLKVRNAELKKEIKSGKPLFLWKFISKKTFFAKNPHFINLKVCIFENNQWGERGKVNYRGKVGHWGKV